MTATCAVQAKDGPATSSRIPWRIQPRAVPIDVEGVVACGVEELAAVEDLASVDDDPAVAGQDPMFDFDRVTAEILVAEVPAFRCHVARHSTDGPRTLRCRTASRSRSRKYWSISALRRGLF